MAYMFIRDRYHCSLANNWIDDEKNVFVYFTGDELKELLHIGKNKVTRVKQHLIDAHLLEIVKQGFNPKTKKNYPDRIYLLQPEYNPKDLISQNSHVKPLQQSDFPILGTREQNAGNTDNKAKSSSENCNKPSSALQQNDFPILGTNKDKNIDTIKDTNKDTKQWNFSTNNYTPEMVAQQDQDLLKHLGDVLTDDTIPMFLNKDSINLISMWFRTPEEVHDCISTILNAANDSRKEAMAATGDHALHFEDHQEELKQIVSRKLRRYFNRMRTAKNGEIKDPKNYLYASMKNEFNAWQNKIMMENRANEEK